MRTQRLVVGLLAGTLAVACTGTEPPEEETEVQGLILEREDPEANADDEVGDPSDPSDPADGADATAPDEAPGDTGVGRDRGGSTTPSSAGSSATGDGSGGSATGPTGSSGGDSSSPAPRTDAPPSEPAPERPPSQPDRPAQPDTEPDPDPEPEPEPEPEVAPARLEDGFERSGATWSVQEGEWVEASSRVHAPDRPLVEAGLVSPEDPDSAAPERDARCAVVLHAPRDRGLRAQGELEVVLVAEDRDGQRTSLLRYVLDLDVELAADAQSAMTVPDRSRTVARDEVSTVSCEVRYTAR